MNSRLVEMIARGRLPFKGGQWIDTYNQITDPDCAGTIIAGINAKNHYYVMEEMKPIVSMELSGGVWDRIFRCTKRAFDPNGISPTITAGGGGGTETKIAEPIVLGLTRDEKGNVVDRHPVEVVNAVTAAKRDNTQNYVVTPINDQDGCSRTIKRQYQQTSRANLERQDALGATGSTDGFRIRKLTPRECFRLMGVSDADIDKIQAAGISKSQQYKMAGNSIVVNCLSAIFRQLFIGNFNKVVQTEIF